MGASLSRLVKRLVAKRDTKILMVGLDASGKTTILYKLKCGEFFTTVPTIVPMLSKESISKFLCGCLFAGLPTQTRGSYSCYKETLLEGFNVEAVEYKNISFNVWDLGGQDRIRPLWRHYIQNIQGLIFVVDSNDRGRIPEARNELHRILSEDELGNATLLVFANKQDLPHAMHVSEVADKLALHSVRQRQWYIQGTSATTGQGLQEGLDWLSSNIHKTTNMK